jgi:hypothetical protein
MCFSFYPGVAQSVLGPSIAAPSSVVGLLDTPDGDSHIPSAEFGRSPRGSDTSGHHLRGRNGPRATKVAGSLEHPILPMPPVCS